MEPVSEANGGLVQGQPEDLAGEGPVRSAVTQNGSLGAPVEPEAALPASPAEGSSQGIIFLQDERGSGTGRAGHGAADYGSGSGGGGAGGVGGTGFGQGIAGGTGGFSEGRAGTGVASRGGGMGLGGGTSAATVLQGLRRPIEQARTYPEAARRHGIQGTVDLRFRIAADGTVEAFEILRSSGFRILDEAAEQTIRRAAPYPPVSGWIRLPLSYRLDH